jgi:hypothetical protein
VIWRRKLYLTLAQNEGGKRNMKIGIVQTRGIGDIIIALPIAKFYSENGFDVFWPIDKTFLPSFQPTVDYVNFIPVEPEYPRAFYEIPIRHLSEFNVERTLVLYSYLKRHEDIINEQLACFLKFDEYKYTVAKVPFREKWKLRME